MGSPVTEKPGETTNIQSLEDALGKSKEQSKGPVKFGMFQGVFTPTLLTILGVIMYLRGPWVVGNAGLIGAIGIITLATVITFFTALSMSSIVTNIRIKAGGAFSIISQSLGLEAGGAIGIPLYIAQALAVAMYVFGFREGWLWIFPNHPAILVDLGTFAFIFIIANISTDFAFKIQYFVLIIIAASLVSIGMGFTTNPINTEIQLFGEYKGSVENDFSGSNFWIVFAVYFPAVTGIMAGANMSGDLENPRKSIPTGTLSAVILCYFIYVIMAVVIAFLATPQEMLEDYNILIDKAYFAPLVLAGLLGATFSSALSSLVGAPRILSALGQNNILFMNSRLAKVNKKGEPKFALYLTSVIIVFSLLLRDLNAIAPLLTMFFLITYAMINVVVLIEQSLGQISFRPMLRVPIYVPLLGAIGCFFVMFIINSTVGLISIGLVVAMYVYLTRSKQLETEDGDTRSGMFNSLAEWSAKMVTKLPEANERSWQPNLLIPAKDVNDVVRSYKIIYNLARPKGSVKILGFPSDGRYMKLKERLPEICNSFMEQDISATFAIVKHEDYQSGVLTCMQGFNATFFSPNTLFLSLTDELDRDHEVQSLLAKAKEYGYGAYLYVPFKKVGLGLEKTINLWLNASNLSSENPFRVEDLNVGLFTAYLLTRNWKGKLNIMILSNGQSDKKGMEKTRDLVSELLINSRMPKKAKIHYLHGNILDNAGEVPRGDLNVITLKTDNLDITAIRANANAFETSCLYTLDGGFENALA